MLIILTSVLLALTQPRFLTPSENEVPGGRQLSGLVTLDVAGKPVPKRYVLRLPSKWNGALVVGAHGGSGGDAIDRQGNVRVPGSSDRALDDVIGDYAFANGFAYASVDRDGIGGTRVGMSLVAQFTELVKAEVVRLRASRYGGTASSPMRTYIVGLSAGGGIARMFAESTGAAFDGALLIAAGGGDVIARLDRDVRLAALWPLIDPRAHFGLSEKDPKIVAFAEAIGTPVAARRLWPYTGTNVVAAASRPPGTVENSTARPSIPVIEVVGTWDDIVIREVRSYRERVEPKERHRLYQVEGVWHMSGDDDGVEGFQYNAETRIKLDKDVADAMGEGPSYIAVVQQAFDHLVRWVENGTPPPTSQTIPPRGKLR